MTDHKAVAEKILQESGALMSAYTKTPGVQADVVAISIFNATVAQAEATLYLADQQRLANLIAYHETPSYIKEVHDALGLA